VSRCPDPCDGERRCDRGQDDESEHVSIHR
jgi:hypothetical protein